MTSLFGPGRMATTTPEGFVQLETKVGRGPAQAKSGCDPSPISPAEASAVVEFWRAAGPKLWFAKDPDFDARFRRRFLASYEALACGVEGCGGTAQAALAWVLLLDQFPRNAFRGTPRMYATDVLARAVAAAALDAGHDEATEIDLRLFFYLPFAHSERMADQDRSVDLNGRLGEPSLSHAEGHRAIIRRFGRFPHRNPILGRAMTPEEQRFLDDGGYAG